MIKTHIKNLQKIFLPFCKYLLASGTVNDGIQIRTKKIKLKNLTSLHKKTLDKWRHAHRYSYNKAINLINNDIYIEPAFQNFYNYKKLPEKVNVNILQDENCKTLSELNITTEELENIFETPSVINRNKIYEWKIKIKDSYYSINSRNKINWVISGIDNYIPTIYQIKETYRYIKKSSVNTSFSDFELRNLIVPKSVNSRNKWLLETPKEVRSSACFEAKKNLDVCFENLKQNNIKSFALKYKKSKNPKWTIGIPKSAIKLYKFNKYTEIGVYEASSGNRFRLTESINEINCDCEIHFDGLYYYICIPYSHKLKTVTNKNWFCSLDPGERKFQTLFCPDENFHIKVGDKCSNKLYKRLLILDNLISTNSPKKILLKVRKKIENLQKELHDKTSSYICNNFENIYIPMLTKNNDIISLSKRVLKTKIVRKMVVLGHCKFVEKLKTKAQTFTNVKVNIITEEYTSQKCLNCKQLTKTSNEIYRCKHCNFTRDRDMLGSVNILIKNW
jgi:transposase